MPLPRLRPALRFALIGLALALLVTFVAAGPFAPLFLLGLAPFLAPAVLVGVVFAAAAGDWLERRGLAARGWAGALLGLSTLTVAALTGGLCAWVADDLGGDPTPYLLGPLWVAAAFGGVPSLLLGLVYARDRSLTKACRTRA